MEEGIYKEEEEKGDSQTFLNRVLLPLFNEPDSPYQYASPTALFKYIQRTRSREIKKKWPLRRVRDFVLFHSRARQIVGSRPSSKFDRSPTLVHRIDDQWQADLVEERKLKWGLGRKKFLLTVIDVFSRQAMVGVTFNKTGAAVLRAFKKLVDEQHDGKTPWALQTDQGKEFFNKEFTKYCRDHHIRQFHTHSPMKASLVERFNRTLQDGLAVLKRHEPTLSLQQAIRRFTKAYNLRPHRGLGGLLAPADITYENQVDFQDVQTYLRRQLSEKSLSRQKPFQFQIGDFVRTSRLPAGHSTQSNFRKSYRGTWSEQVFEIRRR